MKESAAPVTPAFDEHAVAIAKRQYFGPGDGDLWGMFRRVAAWVASPEAGEAREAYEAKFYDLMASKRFCPGGRVLAGAATSHGNVLNCFVQDGSPEEAGTDAWVLSLATKLALVTKVGGGNGALPRPAPAEAPLPRPSGQALSHHLAESSRLRQGQDGHLSGPCPRQVRDQGLPHGGLCGGKRRADGGA